MNPSKKPEWFRKTISLKDLTEMRRFIKEYNLNTVCEEAACPNRGECYKDKTLTVMILGQNCTRNCKFCNVTKKKPDSVDEDEPYRVAEALSKLNLDYVVITSVTRDDLKDSGAEHFAKTITEFKKKNPDTVLEVLVPDFLHSIDKVVDAQPDVISHNMETVFRLYEKVRPQANYHRSLKLLEVVKKIDPKIYTKSGIMAGLGETYGEVMELMFSLKRAKCDVITLGQYARPSKEHIGVAEWIHPDIFEDYKEDLEFMGFLHVESGPYVRSSFHAANFLKKISKEENVRWKN
jgi:lipoic acid synthetase